MNALELFPCSGGMAEGFRRAGIVFDHAFDIAKDHCDSYEKNLGHRPVQMDVRDLLRMVRSGWAMTSEIDLVVADPPCTPWSRAGKRRGVEDPRDMLGGTCELIRLLRPRAYLIGNVPGLDDATQWHHVQRALAPLRKAGYCIADYVSLDAADFGVPQHRVRPFWFGHLAGPCISWPLPTHGAPSSNGQLPGTELKPWVTCRDALQHLPIDLLGRPVHLKRRRQGDCGHPSSEPDAPAHGLPASMAGNGGRTLWAHPDHRMSSPGRPAKTRNTHGDGTILVNDRHLPGSPAPAITAKIRGQSGQVLDLREPKSNHPISRPDEPAFVVKTNGGRASQAGSMLDRRQKRVGQGNRVGDPAAAACTVTTKPARVGAGESHVLDWPWERPNTDRVPPPGHHPESGSILSGPNAVVLSELAATILQGFPETWCFSGATKTVRWSQLGQAMPPPLAEAVARSVRRQLEATRAGCGESRDTGTNEEE